MKAIISQTAAPLYAQPNAIAAPLAEIPVGEAIDLGATTAHDAWAPVRRANGQKGYIAGATPIIAMKKVKLLDAQVEVRGEPAAAAPVMGRYAKGQEFWLMNKMDAEGGAWVRIRDLAQNEGYVPAAVRIQVLQQPQIGSATKAAAQKAMLVGLAWCVGGLAVTAVTYSMASGRGGGTYFIAWGPAIFGGYQFLRGVAAWMSAKV